MAIANIEAELDAMFKEEITSEAARNLISERFWHEIDINGITFSKKFADGINKALNMHFNDKNVYAEYDHILEACQNIFRNWAKGGHNIPNITFIHSGDHGFIIMETPDESGSQFSSLSVNRRFRKDVYNSWQGVRYRETGGFEGGGKIDAPMFESNVVEHRDIMGGEHYGDLGSILGKKSGFSHSPKTNVAKATAIAAMENADPGDDSDYSHTVVDIVETLVANLKWGWKKNDKYGERRWIIKGELAGENLPFDDKIDWSDKFKRGVKKALKKIVQNSDLKDDTFQASPSFRQQQTAAIQYKLLRELMTKNKKYIAVKKIKTKEPKFKDTKGTVYNSRKAKKPKVKRIIKRQAFKISGGREKGQGKEASTSAAADLARLRKYIQGRLPAEVRRNMGRPALRNRTGRFSNSVQLLSLTQAQNTIMAKYTYLLSPYQTFENTGRKRWPMAYNPKPIIAKSIRNLALGRIKQKLTVRRV